MEFGERGSGREREGEKRQREREALIGCLSHWPPVIDRTCNLGMCPDQDSNPQHFGLWDDAPAN